MCTITLERNTSNDRFLAVNTILAKQEIFSLTDIIEELQSREIYINNIVESCLEDLINNGLIYEIGSKYKVRNRKKRWSMM